MKNILNSIMNYFRNMYVSTLVIMYDAIFYPLDEINNNKANEN